MSQRSDLGHGTLLCSICGNIKPFFRPYSTGLVSLRTKVKEGHTQLLEQRQTKHLPLRKNIHFVILTTPRLPYCEKS